MGHSGEGEKVVKEKTPFSGACGGEKKGIQFSSERAFNFVLAIVLCTKDYDGVTKGVLKKQGSLGGRGTLGGGKERRRSTANFYKMTQGGR